MTSAHHNHAGRMASHGVVVRAAVAPTTSSWPILEPTTGATAALAGYPAFTDADKPRSQRPPEPSP
ncbi:MAG: hypothetical protein R2726_23110 [Acidimicrobiales bacterium]